MNFILLPLFKKWINVYKPLYNYFSYIIRVIESIDPDASLDDDSFDTESLDIKTKTLVFHEIDDIEEALKHFWDAHLKKEEYKSKKRNNKIILTSW